MHSFIGHFDMKRVFIRIRIDGNGLYTHFPRGLDDTAGDFPAIGDQNLLEHGHPNLTLFSCF